MPVQVLRIIGSFPHQHGSPFLLLPSIHEFPGRNYISHQTLPEAVPFHTQWALRLLPAATFCIPHYPPPHWVTRTLRSISQDTWTLSPPWQFFSWSIPCVRMKSHCNKHRALLVLSTASATFSKRSLHSAPNSMEHCALFHWILSHFCTLIFRVIQFCISSFCVFMNPLNLASLAKFYQHTPNFCTKTINRNTK